MGRPSRLEKEPDLTERIAQKVADWNFPSVAAQSEGVPERTYYQWMEYAEEGREPYLTFSQEIARAFAEAEVSAMRELRHPAGDKDGRSDSGRIRAAQFFLERARRERYGQAIEVRQKVDEVFRAELERLRARLDPSVWRAVLQALAEDAGGEATG